MKKKEKIKNNSILWWLLGVVLPPIGIILFFINRKQDKMKSKELLTGSIIGFLIYLFKILIVFTKIPEDKRTVSDWHTDVNKGGVVVTVIGASYCSHCQEYKPVIRSLARKYKFNLYFFESDTLGKEDQNVLYNTFELPDFEGYVPYTVIIKDGKPQISTSGFADKETTINFLKENGVIKN